MSDSLPLPPPVPEREPQLIPMLLMRCGMESAQCEIRLGVAARMEATSTGKELFERLKSMRLHLVVPKSNGRIHASMPLDDFLPDRPVLVTAVCEACLKVAKANNMIDGEI